ncbi:MAG: hypothetical protein A2X28_07395 [Elusimicrobia bacterium GWA2_56_46]|nr:MAG: hypothetical protein A2X28_07395 [Elusimicrobia bacterium GWA2_56_46]OGR54733.1 MAG: hypothetical protein A2X39_10595 [Elusimicrobia bacterium GWC2_56_31]HBW23479.1 DUF192 domain-containing protein [Elusimicrobiota bacterium]
MKREFFSVLLFLFFAAPAGALEIPRGASEALLVLPDGFKVRVELALTGEAQARGLMFRKELKEDRGMLFVFGEAGEKSFWMKNTFVELDMVFLDAGLKVGKVFHRVPPSRPGQKDFEVAGASAPASCVLELAGGAARRHGLRPGARLKISFPSGGTKKRSSV